MGDLVNLRQVRKLRKRRDSERQADTNRALHGRTREERKRDRLLADGAKARLDGHMRQESGD